mgnify:CR=1 FL=1
MGASRIGLQVDGGEDCRDHLIGFGLVGFVLGLGTTVGGVVLFGSAKQIHQALRVNRVAQGQAQGQRQGKQSKVFHEVV